MNTEADSWFAQLPAVERAALHARGTARHYRAGSTLFNEGDLSDWVVLLTEGRVKVSAAAAQGREVLLAVRGPGQLLGELSAVDAGPRSATVTAIDPVDARIITGDGFREFLAANPATSLLFLRTVSSRLRDSDRRRVEFVGLDTVGRVAGRLVELALEHGVASAGAGTRIDLPLSQDELAGLTGASREAVSKALRLFRSRGWITTGRRCITVIDLDSLRSRAT
jgi:CRP-like cAMP-binding protein